MALDVKVKIDLTKPIPKLGFGIPLLIDDTIDSSSGTEIDYAVYEDLDAMETAGFSKTGSVYLTAQLIWQQSNAPKKIAAAATKTALKTWLTKPDNLAKEWRQLINTRNGYCYDDTSSIADISAAIPKDKVVFMTLPVAAVTAMGSAITANDRLFVFANGTAPESDSSGAYKVGALVGATAGLDAGSFTYKNIILTGIEPDVLTDTEINKIHQNGAVGFVTKAGDNVTTEGKATSGEYLDIIDSQDYITQQLEYQTQKLLNSSLKIPYDNNGIAMLESVAINVMQDAYGNGIIATDENGKPAYSVSYAQREEVDDSDRVTRTYAGGSFKFTLAGAIHEVEITGEIEI